MMCYELAASLPSSQGEAPPVALPFTVKTLKCLTLGSETSNKYFSIIMIVWLSTKFWSVVIDNHSVVV